MAANGVVSGKSLIVGFGEMLIGFVPTVSDVSLAEAPGFLKAPGGAPANVAIAVARLGEKASFIGKLGDDEFGHMLANILKQKTESPTMGYCLIRGTRLLSPSLRYAPTESGKVFHYGSISLIVEPCRSAHLKAMEVAKEAGALLSYDPNLRLPLWPSAEEARKQILSIWDKADIVKVSDVELEFLTGSDKVDDETAMKLWRPNFTLLLVTLGEKGSRYYTKKFHGTVDAFHVNTVDTTGTGDSFVGALPCKIVHDPSILEDESKLREVLRFASACGAITTTKKGAIPALPTKPRPLP
ncbi:hypothetical protein V6N13_070213 [Hibiscus sabdariffa]